MSEHETFLRDFYRALNPATPAEPASPQYIPLYEDPQLASSDPIAELKSNIDWSSVESAQLFSGFRGTGKSTELRRLRDMLKQTPHCVVVLCDMRSYLNLSTPIDISDFLLSVAGAFSDALEADEATLGANVLREGYWTRFTNWLQRTQVDTPEVGLSLGVDLKVNLKDDPSFRRRLQERMKGHVGALTRDVHLFFEECVKALRQRHGPEVRVVLILDSVEQIQGAGVNAAEVSESVATLFHGHAEKLKLPYVHVVYTVPPWLKIKAPATATLYSSYQQIPCVKVRDRAGAPYPPGIAALECMIAARGDWRRLLEDRGSLERIILASGGYLRDLLRLLQAVLVLVRHKPLPATHAVVELAISQIRNSYLPMSESTARWLARIHTTQGCALPDDGQLDDLTRFFNNLLVMTWRNGEEWYGVHPILLDEVRRMAEAQEDSA
jgi:hypothetical protein